MIPSSRSVLSRDKRLPLDTWNASGLQENVFGDHFSTFDSPPRSSERESVPQATGTGTLFARDDKQNRGTIPMPTFATRLLTTSSTIPVEFPQNYMVGQQISELQFDKFLYPQSLLVWKIRFKNQVTT